MQVDASVGRILLDAVLAEPTMQITIDIEQGTLEALSARIETTFPLDEFTRARLVNGWDDIGLTLRYEDEIEEYEAARVPRGSPVPADRQREVSNRQSRSSRPRGSEPAGPTREPAGSPAPTTTRGRGAASVGGPGGC